MPLILQTDNLSLPGLHGHLLCVTEDIVAGNLRRWRGGGGENFIHLYHSFNHQFSSSAKGLWKNPTGPMEHRPSVNVARITISNLERTCGGIGLTALNSKQLFFRHSGISTAPAIIFIHGLGGTSESFTPLISILGLDKTHSLHLLDLEGQGLSPTSAASVISISSYASDVYALARHAQISQVTIVAHSMGCLIVPASLLVKSSSSQSFTFLPRKDFFKFLLERAFVKLVKRIKFLVENVLVTHWSLNCHRNHYKVKLKLHHLHIKDN